MDTQTIAAPEVRSGDPWRVPGYRRLGPARSGRWRSTPRTGTRLAQFAPDGFWCPSQDGEREYQVRYGGEEESCTVPISSIAASLRVGLASTCLLLVSGQRSEGRSAGATLSPRSVLV